MKCQGSNLKAFLPRRLLNGKSNTWYFGIDFEKNAADQRIDHGQTIFMKGSEGTRGWFADCEWLLYRRDKPGYDAVWSAGHPDRYDSLVQCLSCSRWSPNSDWHTE